MSDSFKHDFEETGYAVARGLFAADAEGLRDHYMTLRRRGSYQHDLTTMRMQARDPLRRYPRMAQMHRWDDTSLRWLLDERIAERLVDLLGEDPYAVQTMLYFKPPGARGQALHQDNFYLKVQPGTCVAAWLALDAADDDNGCMLVVPGSHRWPILCTEAADTRESFTDVTVPLSRLDQAVPVRMEPGDVLFFNGSLVHGSKPNRTEDRFRRALIGHYIQAEAQQVADYYHPVLQMNGRPLQLGVSEGGGACGEWTKQDGRPVIALTGAHVVSRRHE